MRNLADSIENFIISELLREREEALMVQRNELAERMDCAPSQISYVLSTRFTPDRGYMVESRRGSGGFVRIMRMNPQENVKRETTADEMVDHLLEQRMISNREQKLLHFMLNIIDVNEDKKKIIVTGNLNVETLDFDNVLNILEANVKKYGGYIQGSSISSNRNDRRYYDACIRIPAESYNEFLNATKENVNVIFYSENTDDITEKYTDIQARINSLKAEEAKVLEFYDKANNLEELMSVESRLTDIRYEIDSLETKIKNYDLLVNYSTLNIGITETKVYTKTNDNFFSKLGLNFVNGWSNFVNVLQDIILGIVYNLWIVILVVVVIVGIVIYRKKRNK